MDSGALVKSGTGHFGSIRRWPIGISLFLFPVFSNCQEKEKSPAAPPPHVKLSTHPKAVAAAARVRPQLDTDLAARGLRLGDPIFIRAFKEERILELFVRNREAKTFELFRSYPIAAASGTLGPKFQEGDGQVPEGFYSVTADAMNPESQFNLSFNIGYPNAYDRLHGRTGSFIMIHGNEISIGCLAMTDPKIDEIWTLADAALQNVQTRFQVHLFPFRFTPNRLQQEAENPNLDFWKNLQQGYDSFENNHLLPQVDLDGVRYIFRQPEATPH